MTWGTDGAVSKMPMAVVIEDGAYVIRRAKEATLR